MGNNNFQFRLQSLDVLDQYAGKLKQEADNLLGAPIKIKNLHESFADNDEWNDIRHTEFFEGPINEIILETSKLIVVIDEAIQQLNQLKNTYASVGIK